MRDSNGKVFKLGSRVTYLGKTGTVVSIDENNNTVGIAYDEKDEVVIKKERGLIPVLIILVIAAFLSFFFSVVGITEYLTGESDISILFAFLLFINSVTSIFFFFKSFSEWRRK